MFKPKIFVVGPIPPPIHGQSIAVQQIIESDKFKEFEFFVFNKASFYSQIGDQGNFRVIKILRDFMLVLKLFIYVIFKSPSICYMTMAESRPGIIRDSFIINICSKFSQVIIHLHCGVFRVQYEKLNFIEKWFVILSLRQVEKVIVLSERFRSMFTDIVAPSKICVVQNGLPELIAIRSNPAMTTMGINILFLSNLQPEKGLWDILKILGCLKSRRKLFKAIIAGPFPDDIIKIRAIKIIKELNLENNVTLPGIVTGQTKASLYANADVFVFLPNQIEGQPLVIIEALMSRLPIIATPQGSIAEMVIDGENGFIVPVNDTDSVVNKIEILMKNPLLRIEMGKKSRHKYLKEYTEEKYINGIKLIFDGVLAK